MCVCVCVCVCVCMCVCEGEKGKGGEVLYKFMYSEQNHAAKPEFGGNHQVRLYKL